jgi:hypothetical protein
MVGEILFAAELTRRALFTGAASGIAAPSVLGATTPTPSPSTATAPAASAVSDLVFNVRDFGAVGDGTTDDLPAISAAISAATAQGGGTVWFPVGVYSVSGPIGDTSRGLTSITLAGAGSQIATLRASTNAPILTGLWYSCTVVNLVLDANHLGSPCISAHLDKTHLERLLLLNWQDYGIKVNDGTFSDDGGLLNSIDRCNIYQNSGTGIHTGYRFYDSWIVNNNIGATYADLSIEGGPVRILGNHLDGSPTYNIEFRGNRRIVVAENILEGSRKQSIVYTMPPWLDSDKPQIQIVGNTFSNGGKLAQNVYPAISIVGRSSTQRTEGFSITGNTFACDDVGAGWTYVVEAQFARAIAATGNQWREGHMATQPCRFVTCSNTEVIGNHADNAVKTT